MGHSEEDCGSTCPGGLAQQMPAPSTMAPCMPRWCLSDNHTWQVRPCPTSRRYNHQRSLRGGELLLTSPQIKPPPRVAQRRTTAGLQQEGRDTAANPSVTQEMYQGWRVHSHCIRRVIGPPGRCPVPHHHHQHLKEPSLGGEVRQGLPSMIPCGWQQTFVAVDGGRTWCISSRSTISATSTTLWRQTGQGSRSGSLTTSSSTKRKPGA